MVDLNTANLERITKAIRKLGVDNQTIDIKALWNKDESYQQNKGRILEKAKELSPDINKGLEEKHQKDEQEALEREMTKLEEEEMKKQFNKKIEELKKSEVKELSNYYRNYYSLIENFIKNDKMNGMFVVGVGGVGKSFNLFLKLKEMEKRFEIIKGHISPLSFYRFLYEHKDNEIIVIDDVVKLIKNEDIIALLLGAVDFDNRLVVWTSQSPLTKDLPKDFIFNSKVFILANEIDENDLFVKALKDRCIYYELKFKPQKILEMLYILAKAQNYPMEFVDCIKRLSEKRVIENLSLRLLPKLRICDGKFDEIVEIDEDKSVVLQLMSETMTEKEKIKRFGEETGLSRATYYRYLKSIKTGEKIEWGN